MPKRFYLSVISTDSVHLDGYKQGRYKEYFLSTEIGRFIKKTIY